MRSSNDSATLTSRRPPARRRQPLDDDDSPPPQAGRHRARWSGRTARRDRLVDRAGVQAVCSPSARRTCSSAASSDAAVRHAVRGRRLPVAAVLAADRRRTGCRAGSARDCSSCGSRSASGRPATTTGRPTTASTSPTRRAAPSASRRSTAVRDGDGLPVHPPEPPPLLPVSGVHPAVLPLAGHRRRRSVRDAGPDRAGRARPASSTSSC